MLVGSTGQQQQNVGASAVRRPGQQPGQSHRGPGLGGGGSVTQVVHAIVHHSIDDLLDTPPALAAAKTTQHRTTTTDTTTTAGHGLSSDIARYAPHIYTFSFCCFIPVLGKSQSRLGFKAQFEHFLGVI